MNMAIPKIIAKDHRPAFFLREAIKPHLQIIRRNPAALLRQALTRRN
jgi:hypothetical protein